MFCEYGVFLFSGVVLRSILSWSFALVFLHSLTFSTQLRVVPNPDFIDHWKLFLPCSNTGAIQIKIAPIVPLYTEANVKCLKLEHSASFCQPFNYTSGPSLRLAAFILMCLLTVPFQNAFYSSDFNFVAIIFIKRSNW